MKIGPFFLANSFARHDEDDDELFYSSPRYVPYIDLPARKTLDKFHLSILPEEGKILDLMSGSYSHLQGDVVFKEIIGLGLNEAELRANSQLTKYVVHNLNREPILPFEDAYFEACIFTFSVQYLVRPIEVFAEVARVLKPDAPFTVAFSDHMFPTKAVSIWRSANVIERSTLIKSYINHTGQFGVATFDTLYRESHVSDSIYVVSTSRSNSANAITRASRKSFSMGRRVFLSIIGASFAAVIITMKQIKAADPQDSNVAQRVQKIVVEHLGVDAGRVRLESRFVDDLGADSLDVVELVMAFEEEFGIEIPDEVAEKMNTVQFAISYIESGSDSEGRRAQREKNRKRWWQFWK